MIAGTLIGILKAIREENKNSLVFNVCDKSVYSIDYLIESPFYVHDKEVYTWETWTNQVYHLKNCGDIENEKSELVFCILNPFPLNDYK